MEDLSTKPELYIAEDATPEQRKALVDFVTIARTADPGVVEDALQIEAQIPENIMLLVRRVVRDEVELVYNAFGAIVKTSAYKAISGFDESTEATIENDDHYKQLLQERDEVVGQARCSRNIIKPNVQSGFLATFSVREQNLLIEIARRKLCIFAGRLALGAEQELAEPA